jgi:hypothetical protein
VGKEKRVYLYGASTKGNSVLQYFGLDHSGAHGMLKRHIAAGGGGGRRSFFNPEDPVEIANAIRRLWNEEGLRTELVDRSRRVAARLTWDQTARIFRVQYRRLAARPLTDADQELIPEPPFN